MAIRLWSRCSRRNFFLSGMASRDIYADAFVPAAQIPEQGLRVQVQLSLHADYALRVLVYLGTHPDRVVTTQEISSAYGISKHHLVG